MYGKFHILETGSYSADKFKCRFQAKIYYEHVLNMHFLKAMEVLLN